MEVWRCPQCGVMVITTDPEVKERIRKGEMKLVECNLWHNPDGTDHRTIDKP